MSWKKDEILELRNNLGFNRTDFAKMLGVDVRSVMRWEKGLCRPTGAPEAILSGVKEKLDKNPEALPAIRDFIGGAVSVGGLAYLIVKLLDLADAEQAGGGGW